MSSAKVKEVSGRDHYGEIYHTELESEAQWLRYGSIDKVDSVELLLKKAGIKPKAVLELGCGTGAVITECQRRGLGEKFFAIDYSSEAIAYLMNHSDGIHCSVADITDPSFVMSDQYFDVVILSHVIEHLEQPLSFLRSIISKLRFGSLILEVPLEDLLGSRFKNLLRDRTRNLAGHVQFFTEGSFRQLLSSAGLDARESRRYVPHMPLEMIDFVCKKDRRSPLQTMLRKTVGYYCPRALRPLWQRLYYAHYSALCSAPSSRIN